MAGYRGALASDYKLKETVLSAVVNFKLTPKAVSCQAEAGVTRPRRTIFSDLEAVSAIQ